MPLRDKAALVTGASRGLGHALFTQLAERGVRVAGIARDPSELERSAAELRARGPAEMSGGL